MNQPERPPWLKQRLTANMSAVSSMLAQLQLNTVCQSATCPNIGECFAKHTATFLILGGICTRNCRFCDVPKGQPQPLDLSEPDRLVDAVNRLGLKHVVITSVTRDDLADGGASQFVNCIQRIRERARSSTIEVLVPDFGGNTSALGSVLDARPEVFNHNVETVPRLYPQVRPQADYRRSLAVLRYAAETGEVLVKSGMMLGLGESQEEIFRVFTDLLEAGVKALTLGQYLRPSARHVAVAEYVSPENFLKLKEIALQQGFSSVSAGPLIRSSYMAAEHLPSRLHI